ncbi:hypothetical protein BDW22DRAFT_1022028 [Trametopsis cervina]|nr:hypothetical protein BDW22DRAFT_1022028 [Trametopsis cervina]
MTLPALPGELWLEILRWATLSPYSQALQTIDYTPFESYHTSADYVDEQVIVTKRALVAVCRQWRYLAGPFLLEDVVVANGGRAMKQALQFWNEERGEDGSWRIRRVCLPYSSCTPWHTELNGALDVIRSFPKLEVLVRPFRARMDDMAFDISAEDCPSMTSLKRLDWWHYNDAARTGGLNSLLDVLHAAPNLQYLSLCGDLWLNMMHRGQVSLPHLATLRLQKMNILFLQQICRWSLPALRNIVLETYTHTPNFLEILWCAYGSQIKTVELGKTLRFYVQDLLSTILARCPNLEELSYYIQFTAPPQPPAERHMHLHTIRLHALPNGIVDSSGSWAHIQEHFNAFSRPFFPSLKHIILYGDWKPILDNPGFAKLSAIVRARNCSLEFARS